MRRAEVLGWTTESRTSIQTNLAGIIYPYILIGPGNCKKTGFPWVYGNSKELSIFTTEVISCPTFEEFYSIFRPKVKLEEKQSQSATGECSGEKAQTKEGTKQHTSHTELSSQQQ